MFYKEGMEIWPQGVDGWIQCGILVYIPRTGIDGAVRVSVCRVQNVLFPTGSWRNLDVKGRHLN